MFIARADIEWKPTQILRIGYRRSYEHRWAQILTTVFEGASA